MSTPLHADSIDRLRILLVDDDLDSLRLLAQQIKSHFGAVADLYESRNSASADKILQAIPIDILITDLDMVDINGFHLLKSVKSREPLTQVVVVTAHNSPNAIRSAFLMGADDYFIKPAKAKELVDAVTHLAARLRRWDESIQDLCRGSSTIASD